MARYQGRLVEWHDDRGYGFIQGISDRRHERVFLHIKSFKQPGPRPIIGCVVEYELSLDAKSRLQAIGVSYVKAKNIHNPQMQHATQSKSKLPWHPIYIVMLIYWVSLFVLSAFSMLPIYLLGILSRQESSAAKSATYPRAAFTAHVYARWLDCCMVCGATFSAQNTKAAI